MSPSQIAWYWRRLRAMTPAEIGAHLRRKCRQWADARRERDWAAVALESSGAFPRLPDRAAAPEVLREALKTDVENILAGRWRAFGHLELKVDDPPQWHTDYLAGKNFATTQSAFKLNHRGLPGGADIKLIWELSRWYQLVRLAQAAYVLGDGRAGQKCVRWLEDWVAHNRPYRGWNWTSALEAGMRLVQFTWIDALLAGGAEQGGYGAELERLRSEILPAHAWFVWRYGSFGSSANNHLLGELAGLVLATVRWPALARWGAPLETLQPLWEREVLAQFAEDGGNREQALNYHLFSWEFCWQTRMALAAAGRKIQPETGERLTRAADFFWEVQARREPWDYGDSDSAYVTPLFLSDAAAVQEWREWLGRTTSPTSLEYWLGSPPADSKPRGFGAPAHTVAAQDWWIYPQTGIALCEAGLWWLRWDLGPLGYLKTAAHGHADAQHLSIWFKGVPLVIDPGTGAYYADPKLRTWLASRAAHNGPCPIGEEYPQRLGAFLWSGHHEPPTWRPAPREPGQRGGLISELSVPGGLVRRRVIRIDAGDGWQVADEFTAKPGCPGGFTVLWQFAPGSVVKVLGERKFLVKRKDVSLRIAAGPEWAEARLVETGAPRVLEGIVSPAFRKTAFAPYLKLTAGGGNACVFRTTFLASDLP